ncbi:MAG: thiolase family protein [Candidatus Omnitrophota bacterium]|nr:thiolase family protein [Candidatus Omnitrophota bacterium]MDZ4241433.1 thiolase family protein [Candidatus Omnitrophota bacterium]
MGKSSSVYLVDGVRTPIGSPFKSLREFSAAKLSALVLKELVRRNRIAPDQIQEVIWGNVVSAGTGQNFAREAVIAAGFPPSLPAYLINNVCGAGLQALVLASRAIRSGDGDCFVVGGAESVSNAPGLNLEGFDPNHPDPSKQVKSSVHDGLLCQMTGRRMGELCEATARKSRISREDQDRFALESHRKAVAAQEQGKFAREIIPCRTADGKVVERDERPRKNLTIERLEALKPAFDPAGTLTAGNSSIPCDAAGGALVVSEDFAGKNRLKPLARVLGYSSIAVDPAEVFTCGPAVVRSCLKNAGMELKDIDLFEISEAFAAQMIHTVRGLEIPESKINIWGGDVALGHPLGAAGARVLVTLMHALVDQQKARGLACVCFGGGGAMAVAVERLA